MRPARGRWRCRPARAPARGRRTCAGSSVAAAGFAFGQRRADQQLLERGAQPGVALAVQRAQHGRAGLRLDAREVPGRPGPAPGPAAAPAGAPASPASIRSRSTSASRAGASSRPNSRRSVDDAVGAAAVQQRAVGLQRAAQPAGRHPQLVHGVGLVAAHPQVLGGEPVDLRGRGSRRSAAPADPLPAGAARSRGRAQQPVSSAAAAGAPGRRPASARRPLDARRAARRRVAGRSSTSVHAATSVAAAQRGQRDVVVHQLGEHRPWASSSRVAVRTVRTRPTGRTGRPRGGAADQLVELGGQRRRRRRRRAGSVPAAARGRRRRAGPAATGPAWPGRRSAHGERDAGRGQPPVVGVVALGLQHLLRIGLVAGARRAAPPRRGAPTSAAPVGAARGTGPRCRHPAQPAQSPPVNHPGSRPSRPCPCRCAAARRRTGPRAGACAGRAGRRRGRPAPARPAASRRHDEGHDPLPQVVVRPPDHRRLGDAGVLQQRVLDLPRADLVAAGLDQVGGAAPDQRERPGLGPAADVAGGEPAVVGVRGRGGVGPVEVAVEQRRAADLDRAQAVLRGRRGRQRRRAGPRCRAAGGRRCPARVPRRRGPR